MRHRPKPQGRSVRRGSTRTSRTTASRACGRDADRDLSRKTTAFSVALVTHEVQRIFGRVRIESCANDDQFARRNRSQCVQDLLSPLAAGEKSKVVAQSEHTVERYGLRPDEFVKSGQVAPPHAPVLAYLDRARGRIPSSSSPGSNALRLTSGACRLASRTVRTPRSRTADGARLRNSHRGRSTPS
jgi:hypothetical protein